MSRGGAFILGGALGFVVQLSALAWLTISEGVPYPAATAIAVELAVLHNFCWHEHWTWRDRTAARGGMLVRLGKYHLTTGITSIGGNLLLTAMWAELLGLHAIAANGAAVAMMSLANFLLADRWVFARVPAIGVAAAILIAPAPIAAAELGPETVAAWDRYVADAEAHLFRYAAQAGRPDEPSGRAVAVPGGAIHHWRGSTLIRGVTVDRLLDALMHPGTPPPQEDVLAAAMLGRSADSLRVSLRLVRRAIVTATYDTEHEMTFSRHSPALATSRSVATTIAEVGGGDRGFLWRLHSYWRYRQVGGDVLVELESISLSRAVPTVLQPIAGPIIGRIARESVTRTLEALRAAIESGWPVRTDVLRADR